MADSPNQKVLLYRNLKTIVASIVVLIIVFSVGYAVAWFRERPAERKVQSLQQQLDSANQRLKLAELRGTLGRMNYQARQNNYTEAAKYAGSFFDGVRAAISQAEPARIKQQLQSLLSRRDEITTELALADPTVKDKLAHMYANFLQIKL